MKAQWTKEKIYVSILFAILIVSIVFMIKVSKSKKSLKESYNIQNRKILIINTGDTIDIGDNVKNSSCISPYETLTYRIKSSNIKPKYWNGLGKIIDKYYNDYDGFVIIHNLDTITYTASALSFILENLNKPVVVTGSEDLLKSMKLVSKFKIPEVMVVYNNSIFRGNQTTKACANKILTSPNYPKLGCVNSFELNEERILKYPTEPFMYLKIHPNINIIVVKLFPGIDAKHLSSVVTKDVRGIILETYDGNCPMNKNFLEMLQILIKRGVVVINVSSTFQKVLNDHFDSIGVISCRMTLESAFTKLCWLLSNVVNARMSMIAELINMPMRGEL